MRTFTYSDTELERKFGLPDGRLREWIEAGHVEAIWSSLGNHYRVPVKELQVVRGLANGLDADDARLAANELLRGAG